MRAIEICRIAIVASSLLPLVALAAPAEKTIASSPKIVSAHEQADILDFPKDRSFGRLYKVAGFDPVQGTTVIRPHFSLAQGQVKLPAGCNIRLELSYLASEDPTPLLKINCDRITSIDARNLDNFDDKTLKTISQLKNVMELRLDTTDVTDQGLEMLKSMSKLVDLNVRKTLITSSGLAVFKEMRRLQRLAIGFNRLSDDSLVQLEPLANLEYLYVPACQLSDKAIDHIAKLKQLHTLELFDNKKITNRGIARIAAALPELEMLTIQGTAVDVGALPSFKKMRNLRTLIVDAHTSPNDFQRLKKELPACNVIVFTNQGVIDPSMLSPLH